MNKYVFILLILLKLFFTLFCRINYDKDFDTKITFSAIPQKINPDEWLIADIAYSYNTGHGYSIHIVNDDTSYYKKTSHSPFLLVFIHVFYQRCYSKYVGVLKETDMTDLTSSYFLIYGQTVHFLSYILTILSIPFFFKILKAIDISDNKYVINFLLFLYIIFPSSLIYIGVIPMYENITVPCLVIMISLLILLLNGNNKRSTAIILALLTGLVISIEPQTLIPILITYGYFLFLYIYRIRITKKYERSILRALVYSAIVILFTIGQTVFFNYTLWNKPVLSTRGDALLWGHNPLAKGCWDGTFDIKGSDGYKYQIQVI